MTGPVLIHPDPQRFFELEVDASNYATGAILFQRDERGKPRPIGYHSQNFKDAERRYDIYDKEITAVKSIQQSKDAENLCFHEATILKPPDTHTRTDCSDQTHCSSSDQIKPSDNIIVHHNMHCPNLRTEHLIIENWHVRFLTGRKGFKDIFI